MKKIVNKIGLYLLVLFAISISLFIICIGYLFLIPKSELFGITYIKDTTKKTYSSIDYDIDLIKTIEIKSDKYNINLISSNKIEDIRFEVYNDFNGFVKTKKSENKINLNYNPSNDSLVLETKTVSGWVDNGSSKINLIIPEVLFDETHNIKLSANKKCNINIEGFKDAKFGSVEVSLSRGDFYFDNISINNLYIKSNRGEIVAGKNVAGEIETLTLDLGRNKVNFLKAGKAEDILKEENSIYSDINFKINKLILRACEKNTDLKFYRCGKILSDTGCVLSGGKITVAECDMFSIESKDFSIDAYCVNDNTYINKFNAVGTGAVSVREVKNISDFKTKNGKIYVGKAEKEIVLESKSGTIQLDSARYGVTAISEMGNVNIKFDKELDNSNGQLGIIDSLRTVSGVVKVYGVNKINLIATGKADIYLEFDKVVGDSEIILTEAKSKIVVPKDEAVELKVVGENCKLDIEVGTTHFDEVLTGEYNPPVCYGSVADGKLLVESSNNEVGIYSANLK